MLTYIGRWASKRQFCFFLFSPQNLTVAVGWERSLSNFSDETWCSVLHSGKLFDLWNTDVQYHPICSNSCNSNLFTFHFLVLYSNLILYVCVYSFFGRNLSCAIKVTVQYKQINNYDPTGYLWNNKFKKFSAI